MRKIHSTRFVCRWTRRGATLAVALAVAACGDDGSTDVGSDASADASSDTTAQADADGGAGLPEGACSVEVVCSAAGGSEICLAPGQRICGGAAPDLLCADDSECAAQDPDTFCLMDDCGGAACVAKCTARSCPDSQVCDRDGRCTEAPCGASDQCPDNSTCRADRQRVKRCFRTTCQSSSECSGYCVGGQSTTTLATAPPVARRREPADAPWRSGQAPMTALRKKVAR